MLVALLCIVAFAPLYWLAVPARYRREALTLASLVGLGLWDVRLPAMLLVFTGALFLLVQDRPSRSRATLALGLAGLGAFFLWNKLGSEGGGILPSQGGLVFLGVSYLVLKGAALLVDRHRGTTGRVGFAELLGWTAFVPTYPAGPIEELEHFRTQMPVWDPVRALVGAERILIGLLKTLLVAHTLGAWAGPVFANPEAYGTLALLGAIYAFTLRFYFDFAGYSDIAIGLGALFGYEIQENFDHPFLRRNLVQLWQHWHMTLTRWLRQYLFIPVSRAIMRRGGARWDFAAIVISQAVTMGFCGIWHGLGWNFVVWGLLQAAGLIWVGWVARRLGRKMPARGRSWWRSSPIAATLSGLLTFHYFAFSVVFVVAGIEDTLRYWSLLFGGSG